MSGAPRVVVVGAGPAGSAAAAALASEGADVLLLEAKGEPGERPHCSGILGERAWEALPVRQSSWITNEIREATFSSPSGIDLVVRAGGRRLALVVDRPAVDRGLARAAVSEGVDLITGARFLGLRGGRAVYSEGGAVSEEEFDYLVGADGAASTVRRASGLGGIPVEVGVNLVGGEGGPSGSYRVRVRSGSRFSWLQPSGGGFKAGALGGPGDPVVRWAAEEAPGRWREIQAGAIPAGMPRRLSVGRVVLVGDAAGQVKPISRGGVYWGVSAAKMAAEAIMSNWRDGKGLDSYERMWRSAFGLELRVGRALRRALDSSSPREIDSLFRGLAGVEGELSLGFDVDEQVLSAVRAVGVRGIFEVAASSPRIAARALLWALAGV